MALVYFDASALVKLCVPESGSVLASRLWNGADLVATSRLSDTELRAALASGARSGLLDRSAHDDALATWESLWPALHVVEVTAAVADRAGAMLGGPGTAAGADGHALRGADAVHVASALTLQHEDTLVAAWDEHVSRAARSHGLRVVPEA
ncbi:type II toxin-antitoxin system VapC family toxin [Oerskovia flava]|uniref:type II toxin-antitoxin system VapC family toxin n=1 Tax=Oerskovia flava TaxID=2986422 RepID=UPI00223EDE2B|nr:type II toxin-antitoxin system VapC family toxin [Oerskovia sp. JB1-3-2]